MAIRHADPKVVRSIGQVRERYGKRSGQGRVLYPNDATTDIRYGYSVTHPDPASTVT